MATLKFALSLAAFFFFVSACANGPCRHLREPQLAENQAQASASAAAATSNVVLARSNSQNQKETGSAAMASIYVYKPDGSLQCAATKGLSLEEMEKQLRGIPVLSRDKRPDGKMHIQVCGSPTGMINVFEINETSIKDAEARGFKKL